ncbi:putative reverse transcriptase domain-containing protein, partial [Tanacetum coccineum]
FAGLQKGLDEMIEQRSDGTLYYLDRIWVPFKDMYWWPGMKRDTAEYVSKCLTCLKVNAEHQRPSGLLQQPEIPVWKWEGTAMDFVTNFPRTSINARGIKNSDVIWLPLGPLSRAGFCLYVDTLLNESSEEVKQLRNYITTLVFIHLNAEELFEKLAVLKEKRMKGGESDDDVGCGDIIESGAGVGLK